jgi:hypothetical protein
MAQSADSCDGRPRFLQCPVDVALSTSSNVILEEFFDGYKTTVKDCAADEKKVRWHTAGPVVCST